MTPPAPPDLTASVRHEAPLDLLGTLGPQKVGGWDPAMRTLRPTRPHHGGRALMAFRTPEGPVTLLLDHELDPDSEPDLLPRLRPLGTVHGAAWGPGAAWSLERLGDLVGLADDPDTFRPENPLIRRLHRHHRGLRHSRTHRVADLIAPIILQQLVTVQDAVAAWRALLRDYGEPAPGPFDLVLPPSMDSLARISLGAYVRAGALGKQGATLQRLGRAASRLDEAAGMSAQDAYRRITSVKGIGPWTAASVMVGGMGFSDVVVVGDFHLPNHVAWALAGEPRGTDERMLELLEPFRPHRGRVVRLLGRSGLRAPKRGPRYPRRDRSAW